MMKLIGGTLAALLLATNGNDQDKHRNPPAAPSISFRSLDRDGDGKITRDEFMNAFATLDRDHDGVLTADELSPGPAHGPKAKPGKSKSGRAKRKH